MQQIAALYLVRYKVLVLALKAETDGVEYLVTEKRWLFQSSSEPWCNGKTTESFKLFRQNIGTEGKASCP